MNDTVIDNKKKNKYILLIPDTPYTVDRISTRMR